jgi:hypothetical protein
MTQATVEKSVNAALHARWIGILPIKVRHRRFGLRRQRHHRHASLSTQRVVSDQYLAATAAARQRQQRNAPSLHRSFFFRSQRL